MSEGGPGRRPARWVRAVARRRPGRSPAAEAESAGRRNRVRSGAGLPTLDDLLQGDAADVPDLTPAEGAAPRPASVDGPRDDEDSSRFGAPGRPLNRGHPFYLGFVGAIGVLIAIGLVRLLGELSGVITLLVLSLFLALGLDPLVAWLERRRLPRPAAIAVVFVGLVGVFVAFFSAVVPPVVSQSTQLASQLPEYVEDAQTTFERSETLRRLDEEYDISSRVAEELEGRLSSGETVTALFGGILGAGRAVVSGVFSAVTVLVLTLYFLASLRGMTAAGYRLVPRSRRRRVQMLGDEVSRRIGGYVIGQVSLATINGVLSFVVLTVVGIPYAAVLAFVVGILGLIPLVGATIGAVIVIVVALFTSVTSAIVLAVYYLVYQQFENYVLGPRIMARTVSVPGAVALVAALAGGSLLGILGALIAIPIAAGVLLIVQEVWMPQQDRH